MSGKVYLVGAGPGDPDLISVRGLKCIQAADVIIYDYLASPALLKHAPAAAELIYVGKKGGYHTQSQESINALIVEKAMTGATVARLKGGDPYIFGRGGEEAQVLVERGIAFEVVPGVTSAIAAAAYAGIPLTHRDFTSTLAFVTGHENPGKNGSSIDWEALAKGVGTIVFFMGVKNLPQITRQLVAHGKPADTPVALIRWGTTSRQVTVVGTLETIVEKVANAKLKPPAITVIGEVVRLRETLNWFENRPLFGKTIVVTRAREQASDLVERLSDSGAECLECPTIKIVPLEDNAPLLQAMDHLADYDWLIFTSVNGVKFFFQTLFETGRDARALGNIGTAVIGPATAQCLLNNGLRADIVPSSYRAESVIEAFAKENIQGKKILLPRALEARPILPVELTRMGAQVDEVPVYRTLKDLDNAVDLVARLEEGSIDMITFTSSSTAKNFKALLPEDRFSDLLDGVTIAAIGPITADTAASLGMPAQLVADTYTIDGLCNAILSYYHPR
ncbi:MAG: uroporphyrinogen-III C-methyltransferase [Desulfobacterales bacterium]|jgi:uroporphyrinogen III methyltransferase/synthase|nr:uroporphyrinogen-III C-methyltransferase [Desulfobacterales bacterium]